MTPLTDPEVLDFIARTDAAYPPEASSAGVAESRAYYDAMCKVFRAPRPEGLTVEDRVIAGVPVRHYDPGHGAADRPFALYLHGGGFVLGGLDSHDDVCAEIAASTGAEVFSADYRLAPEHLYPAQQDDTQAVWRALTTDGRPGVIAGDSAGANLAAGLCIRQRDQDGAMPLAQVLIYPWLGGDEPLASYVENRDAPMLTTADCQMFADLITGGDLSLIRTRADLSPLVARDFTGLPPAVIVTADLDPVRDDGLVYSERLVAAGGSAVLRNEPQLVHGYLRARHISRRAAESFGFICAAIGASVEQGKEKPPSP
ncbi:alpha/beta hydrolase [Paracoccus zhejiangensis]|uniref:Alpha/beta hydrolase n=1 Tax=Paracoccus zhejiangensis TaxID=1077935 RepID=A0A2H5F2B5_9RHOB|nr:alpha/beta hydrolase [Paracoccus zhejiangensis]AUH65673.1 alpha/beta hydrolase [Paracoccus zhejiangensis]